MGNISTSLYQLPYGEPQLYFQEFNSSLGVCLLIFQKEYLEKHLLIDVLRISVGINLTGVPCEAMH